MKLSDKVAKDVLYTWGDFLMDYNFETILL